MKVTFANIKFLKHFSTLFVFSLVFGFIQAQDTPRINADTIRKINTSTKDTLPKTSQATDIKTTVKFTAKDSVKLNVRKKKAAMYEKAQIDYS